MKYNIVKNNPEFKLNSYKININGLDITPKNNVTGLSIKAKKIVITDSSLTTSYIKKKINKKIDKVLSFMIRILGDEEGTTDEDAGIVLDELNKLKGIIMNKYKEHLSLEEYKSLLSKIIILEEEFKKNYNEKIYMNSHLYDTYYEDERIGRSR